MDFIASKDTFAFFKEEMKLVTERYPENFSLEEDQIGLIIGFTAEEDERIKCYGTSRKLCVVFKNTTLDYDKKIEVKVGELSNTYIFEVLESGLGFVLMDEDKKEDNFGLNKVPINKLLVA